MRFMLFGLAALLCQAQQSLLAPDLELLARVKAHMAANLNRLPNYTCLQTIERSYRRAPARKFEPLDTVRLEVALVEGKELFGWPGGDRIAESEISNLVGGTIGNGDFALLAKSIFMTSSAIFRYVGDSTLGGRPAIKFEYRVPLLGSGYHLRVGPREAIVPYHGSFWIEPETLDPLRLEVAVDEVPLDLGLASAKSTMEYGRVEIGGSQFVLPQSSDLSMIENSGSEGRNRTHFSTCRQFAGESVLSFAEISSSTGDTVPKPSPGDIALPENFVAELSLETTIDSSTTAVGDTIRAKLRNDLRDHHKLVVPKGAVLTGRVTRLERSNRSYILEIAATAIDFDGGHAAMQRRENTLWMPAPLRDTRIGPNGRAPDQSFTIPGGPISVPTDHLRLGAGSRLNLRSRLLQSEQ